jgi:hypothetical protein
MKKDKRTNTYLQDTIQKTKDRITRTPLKTGGELMCSRMVGSSYSTSDTCRFTLVKSPVLSHEWGMDREVPFFDLQILITLLVFSNSFYNQLQFITYNMVSSWHRAYRTFIFECNDQYLSPLKLRVRCVAMIGVLELYQFFYTKIQTSTI